MPPPRRFSAAPTLICPHRNKSSSTHSSSSLHHAYSIDSSESMITVVPASSRSLGGTVGVASHDFHLHLNKRSSYGSVSCHSSQAQSPCNGGPPLASSSSQANQMICSPSHFSGSASAIASNNNNSTNSSSNNLQQAFERTGSFYNLTPRSPLMSPRSPSRHSPSLLTPSGTSEFSLPCPLTSSCSGQTLGRAQSRAISSQSNAIPANNNNSNNNNNENNNHSLFETTQSSSLLANTIATATSPTSLSNGSSAPLTVIQSQQRQQTLRWISSTVLDPCHQNFSSAISPSSASKMHFSMPLSYGGDGNNNIGISNCLSKPSCVALGDESPTGRHKINEDLSLAVDNRTSFNSSRIELNDASSLSRSASFVDDDNDDLNIVPMYSLQQPLQVGPSSIEATGGNLNETHESIQQRAFSAGNCNTVQLVNKQQQQQQSLTSLPARQYPSSLCCSDQQELLAGTSCYEQQLVIDDSRTPPPSPYHLGHRDSTLAQTYDESAIDPNQPLICATINDFCARHSREELEYLVGQIEGLKMSECYYSEKNSTLCMIIEVENEFES